MRFTIRASFLGSFGLRRGVACAAPLVSKLTSYVVQSHTCIRASNSDDAESF